MQEVTGGFVELRTDGTFSSRTDYRYTTSGIVRLSSSSDTGRYSVSNTSIDFTFSPASGQLSGSLNGEMLTVRADVELVYRRSAGGPPPPPSNAAPSLTGVSSSDQATLIALVTPVTLGVSATDPDGDAMTATWNLGDGTSATAPLSSGLAATTKVYDAGAFQPTVTVSDGRGGTQVGFYATIRVVTLSGRWSGTRSGGGAYRSMDVTLMITQNGTSVSGNGEHQWTEGSIVHHDPLRLTGSITPPRTVTMSVTIGPSGMIFPALTVSPDARELTTGNWGGPLDQPLSLKLIRQ